MIPKIQPTLSPHQRMLAWDPSWVPHEIPDWMQLLLYFEGERYFDCILSNIPTKELPAVSYGATGRKGVYARIGSGASQLWDHRGSVDRGMFRALVTQPYGDFERHLKTARLVAERLGCVLVKAQRGAPWSPDANFFEFHPSWAAKIEAEGPYLNRYELVQLGILTGKDLLGKA